VIQRLDVSHNDIKKDNILVTYDIEEFGTGIQLNSYEDLQKYKVRFVLGDLGLC